MRQKLVGIASLWGRHLALSVASLVAVFPVLWLVRTSLGTRTTSLSSPPTLLFSPTLKNYGAVLSGTFPRYLLNSMVIVIITVTVVMILGSLAGYSLARFPVRGRDGWFFYMLSTRMGPAVVFAVPYYVIYQRIGLYDTHVGLAIMYTAVNLAFAVWMARSFFEDVPKAVEEAALVDGLTRLQAFRRITLPLATPGLIATAIFVFILAWNEFFFASVLAQSTARTFTTQLPNYITFPRIRWEEMAAAAMIGIVPVVAFAIAVRKNLVRGFTFGTVK